MKHRYYLYILISSSLLFQSCLGTRYLQKNEYLLADQYVVGNKKTRKGELAHYYLQHTNRKFLGMPIWLWIYELGVHNFNKKALNKAYKQIEANYDKKLAAVVDKPIKKEELQKAKKKKLEALEFLLKNGNYFMQLGEPPVIYIDQKRISTEQNLLQYLHTKGYFNARVNSFVKFKNKKAYIIYAITENKPFIIKEIRLHSPDLAIEKMLRPYEQQSLFKKGQNYDQDILIAERARIYDLLLDNGYWGFNKQYIAFNVDTTGNNQSLALETVISLPTDSTLHPVYYLDSIDFSTSTSTSEHHAEDIVRYKGITFKNIKQHFSPSTIANKIPLTTGQLYRKSDIIEAQKRLTNLGIFKNIHVSHDTIDSRYLKTHISTNLLNKFQVDQELGTNFTNISPVSFYKLSFKSRNLFRKLETLTMKLQLSVEAGSIPTYKQKAYPEGTFYTAIELTLPQMLLLLPAVMDAELDTYKPITKLNGGYTITKRANHIKQNVKAFLSYSWQPTSTNTLEFIPITIGVDFGIEKEPDQKRTTLVNSSYKLYNKPALLSSASFRTTFKKSDEHDKDYAYLETLLESGGTLQNLIDFEKLFGQELEYYRYVKCDISYSRHISLQAGTGLAYHLNTGILYPYTKYKLAPSDKYYFIGGSSTIRAWSSGSLGPGSYYGKSFKSKGSLEERAGEFILQANLELRQHLVSFLESAFFIDIGNVWMLHKNKADKSGEDFELNRFYKEIAVGTGIGLRLNFNFLVLCLDVGFKVYDPTLSPGSRLFPGTMFKPTINFGLGYPF